MMDRITEATAAILVAVAGGLVWLVRTILTNQAELAALKEEIAERQTQRAKEADTMARAIERVHARIDDLDKDIKTILIARAEDLKGR
jgi:cell division protein FtsL